VGLGIVYAAVFSLDWTNTITPHFLVPTFSVPDADAIWSGFLLLALPQIPLSLGNSIYATRQIITDYFPDRRVGVMKIGFTYSMMNIVCAFLGGIPVCHGSGGLAGHYTFGGRTGGSVIIYGSLFLVGGLVFSQHFADVFLLFPKPILGVILLFEGLALMNLIRDVSTDKRELMLALIVGLLAAGLPYGFLIGMLVGIGVYWLNRWFRGDSASSEDLAG